MGNSVPSGLVDLKAEGQEIEATHNAESRALVSHETKPFFAETSDRPGVVNNDTYS